MKTEEDVYKEIEDYINGYKHNRPCTLASIKKVFRTPRIIDLVFSHPDIFNLEMELIHVPPEYRSEKVLLHFVLESLVRLSLLSEDEQTPPLLIGFELAKRRYERISVLQYGQYGEKIPYFGKNKTYRDDITAHCDCISFHFTHYLVEKNNGRITEEKAISDQVSF